MNTAAAWSDVAPANNDEAPQYSNLSMGARGYATNHTLIRRGAWASEDKEEKEMPSFSFSSFDAVTTATATNAAPTDDAEAPAKEGSRRRR